MATYTSFLNLEKPTTSETFNLLKMNQNWDKIDAGVSALNSKFLKRFTASSESTLTTACSNISIGEFAVGEIADNDLTGGASVPVIIYKRTENVYFADIIYSGYQGYYYNSTWHWHKFSYT